MSKKVLDLFITLRNYYDNKIEKFDLDTCMNFSPSVYEKLSPWNKAQFSKIMDEFRSKEKIIHAFSSVLFKFPKAYASDVLIADNQILISNRMKFIINPEETFKSELTKMVWQMTKLQTNERKIIAQAMSAEAASILIHRFPNATIVPSHIAGKQKLYVKNAELLYNCISGLSELLSPQKVAKYWEDALQFRTDMFADGKEESSYYDSLHTKDNTPDWW